MADPNALFKAVSEQAMWFGVLAGGALVTTFFSMSIFLYMAEKQTNRLKAAFLQSVLSQNIGWFDETSQSVVASALSNDVSRFQGALGDKVTTAVQQTAACIAGLVVGFIWGWQLALAILICAPLLGFVFGLVGYIMMNISKADKSYEEAGEVAEGALTSISTVTAFGSQEQELTHYETFLDIAKAAGIKKSLFNGLSIGFAMLVMFGAYGLALWYGVKLIANETISDFTGKPYTGGDVIVVFFAVMIGAQSIGMAAPAFPAIQAGRVSAFRLYKIIDRKSPIDYSSKKGKVLDKTKGDIV
eukprot:1000256_1